MAKRSTKKDVVTESEITAELTAIEQKLNEVKVPGDLQDRFDPQIEKVCNRIHKIADNLKKAIALGATKAERDAKKAERVAARTAKLEAQAKAIQEKLAALKE